jgi:hypothetical protein
VDADRYPQVYFGTRGNRIVNLQSDRSNGDQNTDLSTQAANFTVVPYTPEFAGHGHLQASSTTHIRTLGSTDLFRLPVACNANGIPGGAVTYKINYSYFSDSAYVRSGYITVVADVDNAVLQISDEYDTTSIPNEDAVTMRFLASFVAYDGSTWATGTPYGIMISRSTDLSPDSGDLEYTYTSIQ